MLYFLVAACIPANRCSPILRPCSPAARALSAAVFFVAAVGVMLVPRGIFTGKAAGQGCNARCACLTASHLECFVKESRHPTQQ